MSYAPSLLEQLQLDIAGRIAAHGSFANVPVKVLRPRKEGSATMLQTQIDQALEGLTQINNVAGLTVLVNMPAGDVPNPNIPGPRMRLIASVQVIENPMVNMGAGGIGVSAEDIALEILNLLHQWFFQPMGSSLIADRQALDPEPAYADKGYVAYVCRFYLEMGLAGPVKVARPTITGTVATGAIITGPAGAQIYYTVDGTYPAAPNANFPNATAALLATALTDDQRQPLLADNGQQIFSDNGQVPLTAGTLVLAVAYSTSTSQASDLASLQV